MTNKVFRISALAVSALFSVSTAFAQDYTFAYNPVELSTTEGVQSVHNRIVEQAEDICADSYGSTRHLVLQSAVQRCEGEVVGELVVKIDDEGLTQVYLASPQ